MATVCVAIAMLAAAVTIPLAWVASNIADEDGYVSFTSPMGSDPELQKAFSAYLGDYFVREQSLPSALQPTLTTVLETAAANTANAPGFTRAWEESQRSSHRLMFGPGANQDRLAVDLGPLATFAVDHAAGNLPVALPKPGKIVLQVNNTEQREAIDQIEATKDRSRVGWIVVAAAAALSLLFAKRRSTALVWLGVGAVVVAGVLKALTSYGIPNILDRTPAPSGFARTLQKLLADRAADSLAQWLLWAAIAGAAAIVVGVLLRVSTGKRTSS
ncbi:hypothetical protein GCM10022234_13120 [Aeromicrobium panaciterrae]|uniref:hypothetical protein n=1 Tax=Aeromicrobium panaciterrae TaxID=363861 RepID=UPI0031CE12C0